MSRNQHDILVGGKKIFVTFTDDKVFPGKVLSRNLLERLENTLRWSVVNSLVEK